MTTEQLLQMVKDGKPMSLRRQLSLTAKLSLPAMLAQLSNIVMQYIDASMVGSLGADASASIGLVSTTIWLFGGLCSAIAAGFAVQVAHLVGAKRNGDARSVLRQSLVTCLIVGVVLCLVGVVISDGLPRWLGGHEGINADASRYFLIFALCLPPLIMQILGGAMLRCSGNIKVPAMLNIATCVLDVIFNFLFIFPSRQLTLGGLAVSVPGFGLGVTGAALGTAVAEVAVAVVMLYWVCFRSSEIGLRGTRGSFRPTLPVLRRALAIGSPLAVQHVLMCGAQISITRIVAPVGSISIAANAFGITAESLCYMPGYGFSEAATTLVGQSIGAGRKQLTRSFARITVLSGMAIMTVMGVLMYIGAPLMMSLMTPVQEVVELGTRVLRIETWAEPLFGAAIVCNGVFVGAGDTTVPAVMNLVSMWAVRLTLAALLVGSMGLAGVWLAMCIELCFRGAIFLLRLRYGNWIKLSGTTKKASVPI